ncbi:MAG: DUF951 domain-containing protein [Clostridia bacterium]|nr:DUF951 domain-containing protein [Clostridia bacterium]
MDIRPGDILELKKPHPCGERRWVVLRCGIELRLKCAGCGHIVLVPRSKAEKNIRSVIRPNA